MIDGPSDPVVRQNGRAIWRGVRNRCPACGKGQLFRAYLKPAETCAACGEDFSSIQAEDGPSWLTILLLGPILLALTFLLIASGVPSVLLMPILGIPIIGVVLLALPRVKGGFIGALWSLDIRSGGQAP